MTSAVCLLTPHRRWAPGGKLTQLQQQDNADKYCTDLLRCVQTRHFDRTQLFLRACVSGVSLTSDPDLIALHNYFR